LIKQRPGENRAVFFVASSAGRGTKERSPPSENQTDAVVAPLAER